MKTTRLFVLTLVVSLGMFAGRAKAQNKPIPLPPVVVTSPSASMVDKKVTDAFSKKFKDAVSPEWYKANKNYLVKFIMNNQRNNALYTKKGGMIYHISYGDESNLPKDILKLVKTNYFDYNIKTIMNVEMENRDIWVVNLEDSKNYVLVRVEDGQLEEVDRFQRT